MHSRYLEGSTLVSFAQRVVVAAVLIDQGRVLLARRAANKRIAPGKWHLPGGHVESGESPEEALRREIREELGVRINVIYPLTVFRYRWQNTHTFGIAFEARLDEPSQSIRWDPEDLAECLWVMEAELEAYLAPEDHNFLAAKAGFARVMRSELP